jgi:hypothetical protein
MARKKCKELKKVGCPVPANTGKNQLTFATAFS